VPGLGKFTISRQLRQFLILSIDNVVEEILEMDDKGLSSVGDLELSDKAGNAVLNSDVGDDMTRDEREMTFYGKKPQLKVRILNRPGAAMSRV
jgi:hypothetical protein